MSHSPTALVAAVQLTCTSDGPANTEQATSAIRRAAALGARFVATPENTDFVGARADKVAQAEPLDGPRVRHYGALARELGLHLLLGSIAERSSTPGKCHNTSVLLGPDGAVRASYRKLHLFDISLGDTKHQESETFVAGDAVVTAETPLGTLGMSICYDLRFPELYRALRDRGARILAVPAAFTLATGKDHWEVLLRARAVETQCYVIAPAQFGRHPLPDGTANVSWGHSLVVDPWGHVVARASDGPGTLALAELEPARVDRVRAAMPLASHRRLPC